MDPVANPYSPGAGRKPWVLVGRDPVLDAWRTSLRRAERERPDQPLVMYGLRGVGKTVLLSEMRRIAARDRWMVGQVEADPSHSLRELLGESLYEPLSDLARPGLGTRLMQALKTAASFKASYDSSGSWTFGLDLTSAPGGGADTGTLDTDLRKLVRDLTAAIAEDGVGLAILIDEAQDLASDELAALSAIAHTAAQDGWPFMLAFAGLPSLPRKLAEAKSYAERFQYWRIEELDESSARAALILPANERSAHWLPEALDILVEESAKYPYFLQQFGQDTWVSAAGPVIEARDARLGVARGTTQLDNGFFRIRWERATRAEKDYLRAMAEDGDRGSASGDVAARLGKTPQQLTPARASLITKGLVYSPDHGIIAFTVPGMSAFIARQADDRHP